MKRILIFSVAYHPFVGGAEIAVKEITDRIGDFEFEMITLNLDGKQKAVEKIGNVLVRRIGGPGRYNKFLFPFRASKLASEIHKEKPFDAIWSIMASFSGFAAVFFKKNHLNVPFLLTLQEGDPISYIKRQVWFVYPLFKQIFKMADRIQVISTHLLKWAKDMGAICPVSVVPNGVDIPLFTRQFSDEERSAVKKLLGKGLNETLLITTSRLVKKNGVVDVIKALKFLPDTVTFVIIGDGSLKRILKEWAKIIGVGGRVKFLGQTEYSSIPAYLAAADIFIRPSLSEGMGNSFIEAMATGLPVIATPVGGIPDFIRDGETGVFCEVGDPKSIAEKVELLMNDSNLREKISHNGKELARTKYDWNDIVKTMKEVLDSMKC